MKKAIFALIAALLLQCDRPRENNDIQTQTAKSWWQSNTFRIFQSNLIETDVNISSNDLIQELQKFHTNTLIVNAGGVMAFYPTRIPVHHIAPGLSGDLLGQVVEGCNKQGIEVIARFDFSRLKDTLAMQHPEWLYVSPAGEHINNHGLYVTCPSSDYQQTISLDIITEVLTNYPVDGIFFNMFGYKRYDVYNNQLHGFCQCENCKNLFFKDYNMSLPLDENASPAVLKAYNEFRWKMTERMLRNIDDVAKGINKEIGIFNYYQNEYVDVYFHEMAHSTNRRPPYDVYVSSENVKRFSSGTSKPMVNAVMNSKGMDFRLSGVSSFQVANELYQSLGEGSGLAYVINGVPQSYPDTTNFSEVKKVFGYHHKNEIAYQHYKVKSKIALVYGQDTHEYRGVYKMLKELHYPFDVLRVDDLNHVLLNVYKLLVIPDIESITDDALLRLGDFTEQGGHLVATYKSFNARSNQQFLLDQFGLLIDTLQAVSSPVYLHIDKQNVFQTLSTRKQISLSRDFQLFEANAHAKGMLPILTRGRVGPPEKVGGSSPIGAYGVYHNQKTNNVFIAFPLGDEYLTLGYEDPKWILSNLMRTYFSECTVFETSAPSCVEVFYGDTEMKDGPGIFLQMLNHSGFNGSTYTKPLPITGISFKINSKIKPKYVLDMNTDKRIDFHFNDLTISFQTDLFEQFKAIYIPQ